MTVLALGLGASAEPFVRSKVSLDPEAHCLWWNQQDAKDASQFHPLVFHSNSEGNPDTTADSEFAAAGGSLQAWNEASSACGHLILEEGAQVPERSIGFDERSRSNLNLIVYRQQLCSQVAPRTDACWTDGDCQDKFDCWDQDQRTIALTTTSFDRKTGQILDADIEMNAASFVFTTVDSPPCVSNDFNQGCVATDIQNTLTHELGHALGLDHSAAAGSTMNPQADPGETSKRSLDPGTEQFVCDVYPKGMPARDCVIEPVDPELGQVSSCSSVSTATPAAMAFGLWALARLLRRRK